MIKRRVILAAAAVLFASSAHAAEHTPSPAVADHAAQSEPEWAGDNTSSLIVGDPAPAFSYLGLDGAWHDSRRLGTGDAVLLVFGARNEELVGLDRMQSAFDELGVHSVAVLDMRAGSAVRLARRLALTCRVVVDPKCAIAGLYGSLDPVTRRHAPAFFVVDARGTIRGVGRGSLPSAHELITISARSLGQPLPANWSVSEAD